MAPRKSEEREDVFLKNWGATASQLVVNAKRSLKARHPELVEKAAATTTSMIAAAATELAFVPIEMVAWDKVEDFLSIPGATWKAMGNASYSSGIAWPVSDAIRNKFLVRTRLGDLYPWQFGLISGAVNELVLGLILLPLDIISRKKSETGGTWGDAARTVISEEGVRGLFSGFWSSAANRLPLSMAMTSMGEQSSTLLRSLGYCDSCPTPMWVHFATAAGTTGAAICMSTPFDALKKHHSGDDAPWKTAAKESFVRFAKSAPRAGLKRVTYVGIRQQLNRIG